MLSLVRYWTPEQFFVRTMSTPARSRAHRLPSRRCINCSILLAPNLRRYTVEELNEQMTVLLRTWTMPTPVSYRVHIQQYLFSTM